METKDKNGRVMDKSYIPTYYGEYVAFFDKLLTMSDEEIDEVLNSKTVSKLYYYKKTVYYYMMQKSRKGVSADEIMEMENKIYSHLQKISDQKIKNNKLKEQLKFKSQQSLNEIDKTIEANKLIRSLITSHVKSLDHFCEMNSVDRKQLKNSIDLIARNDQIVYAAAIEKINIIEKPLKDHLNEVANNMLVGLSRGIEIDEGKTRSYDLLDYYMATSVSLTDFHTFVKGTLNKTDQNKIAKFVSPNNYCKQIDDDIKEISIKMLKDGVLTLISDEEKNAAISFLEQNQIPIYYLTFQAALRRYVNGLLTNEISSVKTLNNK